jgi:hypothetical protein
MSRRSRQVSSKRQKYPRNGKQALLFFGKEAKELFLSGPSFYLGHRRLEHSRFQKSAVFV